MKKESKVIQIMNLVWSNLDYSSHQRVNEGMASILKNIIEIGVDFEPNDIQNIMDKFRGGYWFGVSRNGKTNGEQFYGSACGSNPNASAAKSFEKYAGRKPFILNNHRLYEGSEFKMNGLYYTISGFDNEKGTIYCVGYINRCQTGKRKLVNYTNEQFLIARKDMELI